MQVIKVLSSLRNGEFCEAFSQYRNSQRRFVYTEDFNTRHPHGTLHLADVDGADRRVSHCGIRRAFAPTCGFNGLTDVLVSVVDDG